MTRITLYDRIRLEALGDEAAGKAAEELIQRHQSLHASRAVLNGLLQLAGSYDLRSLESLNLKKITENEEGKYPSIGKSRSGRVTKNLLVYLENEQGKIETFGWDTFEKHIQLFDYEWTKIPKTIKETGSFQAAKEQADNQALKDYLTTIEQARKSPERIKDIQSIKERSAVISLIGLEERIEDIIKNTTEGLGAFIADHDHFGATSEILNLSLAPGSYLKELEQEHLTAEEEAALERVKKNDLYSNEQLSNDYTTLISAMNKRRLVHAELLIGDYLDDFKEIAKLPTDKKKRFQQGLDLVKMTSILQRKDPLRTYAEAELVWSTFDVPHHRLRNAQEQLSLSEAYAEDYQEGLRIARELFIPEGEWVAGSKTSPPVMSTFKHLPLIALYKQKSDEELKSVMRHMRTRYATRDDEEKTFKSKSMRETREEMDAIVMLARKAKVQPAMQADEALFKETKRKHGHLAKRDYQPIEQFEQEYNITIDELTNRITVVEEESNHFVPRLTGRLFEYKDQERKEGSSASLDRLQKARELGLYTEEDLQELQQQSYQGETILDGLVELEATTAEDLDNDDIINKLNLHPATTTKSNLPYRREKTPTYQSPEEAEKRSGWEGLEEAMGGEDEWHDYQDAITKHLSLTDQNRRGRIHRVLLDKGGLATRRENYHDTGAFLTTWTHGSGKEVKHYDPKKREILQEAMDSLVPVTPDAQEKALYLLDLDNREKLEVLEVDHDEATLRKSWGAFKNATSNDYIQQTLAQRIDDYYDEAFELEADETSDLLYRSTKDARTIIIEGSTQAVRAFATTFHRVHTNDEDYHVLLETMDDVDEAVEKHTAGTNRQYNPGTSCRVQYAQSFFSNQRELIIRNTTGLLSSVTESFKEAKEAYRQSGGTITPR